MDSIAEQVETFEKKVYTFISKCLGKDETIQFDKVFDFYLPKGLKSFNWPEETYVEVKYTLMYNTLARIGGAYDTYHPHKLVVIVMDDNPVSLRFESDVKQASRNIEVMTYDDLVQKSNAVNKGGTRQRITNEMKESSFRENIREKAKDALKNEKVSFFLGAGVSASAGVVTWDSLIEKLCIKKSIPKIDSDIVICDSKNTT